MGTTWILVATSTEARILELGAGWNNLRVMTSYKNPDDRAHEGDLMTDGAAAVVQYNGEGRRYFTGPRVSAREHAGELFAGKLAKTLQQGRVTGSFDDLVLIAPPGLLGKIRVALDDATLCRISDQCETNLSHLTPDQLYTSLRSLVKR